MTQVPLSPTGPGLCMLIADDDRDSAESLVLLMELEGHTVHMAHDGEEALAVAQRVRPQVFILDIGLPSLDGHSVARRIRELLPDAPMLIVALTGRAQPEDLRRSAAAGFDHHFTKPLVLGELHQRIARWRQGTVVSSLVTKA